MPKKKIKPAVTDKKALADALYDEGRFDEAIEEYRSLIALAPADPCAHFSLADALHQKGDLDMALAEIREAMRLKPQWPFYHNKLGKILVSAGDREGAIREFEMALQLKPDYEDAAINLKHILKKAVKR